MTSKSLFKITAIAFAVLLVLSGLSVYGYYYAYYKQPALFSQRIQAVALGETKLTGRDLRSAALIEAERARVKQRLQDDLSAAGVEDDQTASLLLPQATAYLDDETSVLNWVNRRLTRLQSSEQGWSTERLALTHWRIRSGETCLDIERHGHWQLSAFSACPADPKVPL